MQLQADLVPEEGERLKLNMEIARERLDQKRTVAERLGKAYTGIKFLQTVGKALEDVSVISVPFEISSQMMNDSSIPP